MNEIVEILNDSNPVRNGYKIENDKDQNTYLVSEQASKKNLIWINYSKDEKELIGLSSSIVFKSVQKEYAELCYPIITKKLNQKLTKTNLLEQINNPTINCGTKMESPNGILKSRFTNYSINEFKKLKESNELNTSKGVLEFVNWYYERTKSNFFSKLNSLEDLDSITDNLNIYELGLYLTNVPKLKKIIIKHILNKPNAIALRKEYENLLNPSKGNKMVDLIIECMRNIKIKYEN